MSWEEERSQLILDLLKLWKPPQVTRIISNIERRHRSENGYLAEEIVVEALNHLSIVQTAKLGNEQDDRVLDDVLVTFVENRHMPLGIQVKTSQSGEDKYKQQDQDHKINRQICLIVDPDHDSNIDIIEKFRKKLFKMDGYI